jgi:type IV fimbrial biogenesis protein FimT
MESFLAYYQQGKNSATKAWQKGFSLIELVVVMAVLAIVTVFVAPSFQSILMNFRMSTLSDSLFNALNYARSTALSQKYPVQVCPLGSSGSTVCGTSWATGWMVVSQPTSGASVVLQRYQAKTSGPILSAGGTTSVVFTIRGLANTQTNFKICDARGASYARSLMVLPTGFIQSGSTAGQAVWNAGALTC